METDFEKKSNFYGDTTVFTSPPPYLGMGLNSEFLKRRNFPRKRDKRPFSKDTLNP